jgi:hypothetical protein
MRLALASTLATLVIVACVPGSPVYIGRADTVTFEGEIYMFEERVPAPQAEACLFGTDTLCVRANDDGHYWMSTYASVKLADSSVVLRFRIAGGQPAYSTQTGVADDEKRVVNCALSNRVTMSNQPRACLPIP